jgi:hypothetical protein
MGLSMRAPAEGRMRFRTCHCMLVAITANARIDYASSKDGRFGHRTNRCKCDS